MSQRLLTRHCAMGERREKENARRLAGDYRSWAGNVRCVDVGQLRPVTIALA
jgi:hypothetical protein